MSAYRQSVPTGARSRSRRYSGNAEEEYDEDGMVIQPTSRITPATSRRQGPASGARMEEEYMDDDGTMASPAQPPRQRHAATPRPSQPPQRALQQEPDKSIKARASRFGMHDDDDDSAAPLKAPKQRAATQPSRRGTESTSYSRRNQTTSQVGAIAVTGAGVTHGGVGSSSRNTGSSRVGAVRIDGAEVDNFPREDDTVIIGGDPSMMGSGGTVVAEAVTSDDHIRQELRDELRSEIQRELQAQMQAQVVRAQVMAVSTPSTSMTPSTQPTTNVVPSTLQYSHKEGEDDTEDDDKPIYMRKRVRVAALLAVAVAVSAIAIVVVLLFARRSDDGGGDSSGAQNPNDEIVGGTQPGGEPTLPVFPIPSPTPNLRPTASALPPVSLMNRQRLEGRNSGDQYGEFVVISRDSKTMAIGASSGDYVQVLQRNNGSWEQVGQQVNGDGGQFGRCVDLNQDGRVFVAGTWNNNDAGEKAGHGKVYRLNGNSWSKVGQTLRGDSSEDRFWLNQIGSDLEGDGGGIQFGRSIALDAAGRRIAVGAQLGGAVGGGRVRVFDWSGSSWNQVGDALDGDNPQDWQGTSVALSADGVYLAIGTDGTDQNGSNSGSVKTYRFDGSTWVRYDDGMILGEAQDDQFGASQISLSNDGSCLAVGANHFNNDRGKGYLFRYDGTKWSKIAEADGDFGSRFGDAAAVSGDCQWAAWGAIGDSYVDVYQVG